ncbi:hypothetical protein [Lacticaseibacillus brantae]|uniref:Uncharacterized protein n=1 Tax=Lacticaseibacillus brantae DSM 23927 TaxID=1423727 RepID=A0A0R2B7W1_9LACO|nr:hypothetical protein [Lacticaseibacillus brantae]KRM72539.1 hypothetical protein FC34_GL000246 [Lacticaseibacillus brantae DSM 23927]
MLKITSGLTRLEIQKARLTQVPQTFDGALRFRLLPILLLGLGGSLVTIGEFDQWVVAGLIMVLAAIVGLGAHLALVHYLTQLQDREANVSVIRDGLAFIVPVGELVAGDLVVVHAGERTAIDLLADRQKFVVAPVLNWLLGHKAQTVVPAGAIAVENLTATVAGHNGRVADQVVQDFNAQAPMPQAATLMNTVTAVIAGLRMAAVTQVAGVLPRLGDMSKQILREQQGLLKVLSGFFNRMSLVGQVRHHVSESAFRYNQDPVSWPLPN